jgi:hypothetical protein
MISGAKRAKVNERLTAPLFYVYDYEFRSSSYFIRRSSDVRMTSSGKHWKIDCIGYRIRPCHEPGLLTMSVLFVHLLLAAIRRPAAFDDACDTYIWSGQKTVDITCMTVWWTRCAEF